MTSPSANLMPFEEAIVTLRDGQKITRVEWGNNRIYGTLKNEMVQLHKADEKYYLWTINDGDLHATDWIIAHDN